jgi:hypothetical protein
MCHRYFDTALQPSTEILLIDIDAAVNTIFQYFPIYTVIYTPIARQRIGKQVSAKKNSW